MSCLSNIKIRSLASIWELQPLKIPEEKWADVMIDFVTKLLVTRRGHDLILTVADRATKFCHFIPCTKKISAKEIVELYWNKIVCLHGMPCAIHSDQDMLIPISILERNCGRLVVPSFKFSILLITHSHRDWWKE